MYHGVEVADPFRALEDSEAPDVIEWTNKQDAATEQHLSMYADREKVKQRIEELVSVPTYSLPQLVGDYYYYHKNNGQQNQAVFYRAKSLQQGEEEVIIDPNKLNEAGTTAIMDVAFSKDGRHLAYVLSYNGSDGREVKIINLETGETYPETLVLQRHCVIAWGPENDGFYYSNYPKKDNEDNEHPAYHNRVFWHTVGTKQTEDVLIFEDHDQKDNSYESIVSACNDYLLLRAHRPTEPKSNIYYRPINETGSFKRLAPNQDNNFTFINNDGDVFYFLTNDDAPKGRVVAININNPEKAQWQEIIPEGEDTIVSVSKVHDYYAVTALNHVDGRVKLYNQEGSIENIVPLTEHITINGIGATKATEEILISYTSFLEPTQIMAYNVKTNELKSVFSAEKPFDEADFEIKQVNYTSKDGTNVPMYLVHKQDLELTGDNPTLLYAYGGYNINVTSAYTPAAIAWMESGGVYAVPNLRGGGEFGRNWHEGGIFEEKQHVFNDFLHAAEWLIEHKYTNPKKLAIMGGSNGGLLVGASITQRPDLFGAALCLVPVTDMLRFQHFTFGRFWLTEFGNADESAADFKNMYAYSPLHNIEENTEYPPTLVTTANFDDRVHPAHARKFAAALQDVQTGSNPILFKEEKNAGHGEGKPRTKVIDAQADLYTFLLKELDVTFQS